MASAKSHFSDDVISLKDKQSLSVSSDKLQVRCLDELANDFN